MAVITTTLSMSLFITLLFMGLLLVVVKSHTLRGFEDSDVESKINGGIGNHKSRIPRKLHTDEDARNFNGKLIHTEAGNPKNSHSGQDVLDALNRISLGTYEVNTILSRPTDNSVTLSLMSANMNNVYVQYGEDPTRMEFQTGVYALTSYEPANVVLFPLNPDSQYYYRVISNEALQQDYPTGDVQQFHTQRKPGSPFKFSVTADSHYAEQPQFGDGRLWQNTLNNVKNGQADFHIDLGDTYMTNKHVWHNPGADETTVLNLHVGQRKFIGQALRSIPYFSIHGNQDGEFGFHRVESNGNPPIAVWAARARTKFFPQPNPSIPFYTGNSKQEDDIGGYVENYYSWRWGDALFITLDPYFHTPVQPQDAWDWTLGYEQYAWLRDTLEKNRDAKFKVVFSHNIVGGYALSQRGGAEVGHLYEWGGFSLDGQYEFDKKRPGWGVPVHQMFIQHGVDILFHGHDHFFAKQDLDGVIYQLCPKPTEKRNSAYETHEAKGYTYGYFLPGAGHLEMSFGQDVATISYIRSWLPEEVGTEANGAVVYSYQIYKGDKQQPQKKDEKQQNAAIQNQQDIVQTTSGASNAAFSIEQEQAENMPKKQPETPLPIFTVTIPEGVKPGESFNIIIGDAAMSLVCPSSKGPGDELKFRVPDDTFKKMQETSGQKEKGPNQTRDAPIPAPVSSSAVSEFGMAQSEEELVYSVPVPLGVNEGETFYVEVSGGTLALVCPFGAVPGDEINFTLPKKMPIDVMEKENLQLSTEQYFEVVVPEGKQPGDSFQVIVNGKTLSISCPPNSKPGDLLQFQMP